MIQETTDLQENLDHVKSKKGKHLFDIWSNIFFLSFLMSLWFIFCSTNFLKIEIIDVIYGLTVSILTIMTVNKLQIAKKNINLLKNFKFYSYAKNLLKEIFFATMDMVKIIWSDKIALKSKISYIDKKSEDDLELTLISNAITLTPGTIVIALEKDRMIVHSIELEHQSSISKSNADVEKNIKNIKQND